MPEEMKRSQFTFYSSFWEAVKCLPDEMFVPTIKAICGYALDGIVPELDPIPMALFSVIKPNLDSSRRKAENGKRGGNTKQTESKQEANGKQTESKIEKEIEKEKEIEIENECYIYNPPIPPKGNVGREGFDEFWAVYPKKVGKQAALKAFQKVKEPMETLLSALEWQKCSDQWSRDNGRYIPNPATWLNQNRWEDEIPNRKMPSAEQSSVLNRVFVSDSDLVEYPYGSGNYRPKWEVPGWEGEHID